ncbi:MAG: hypothetical protein Q9204_006749 [Flavoplaca sp. TL-2023a]
MSKDLPLPPIPMKNPCRRWKQRISKDSQYQGRSLNFGFHLSIPVSGCSNTSEESGVTTDEDNETSQEPEDVDKENHHQTIRGSLPSGTLPRERFLLPYIGQNKTFCEVGEAVDVINKEGGERLSTRKPIMAPSPATYVKLKPDNRDFLAKPKASQNGGGSFVTETQGDAGTFVKFESGQNPSASMRGAPGDVSSPIQGSPFPAFGGPED